jgi:uncharacterized membrane protein YgcG
MSLDVEEKQVLVYYAVDPVPWHHRLLMVHIGEGRWIIATPDFDVQVINLAKFTVKALGRDAPIPQECGERYMFDSPILPNDLNQLRAEAHRLAEVLGVAATALVTDGKTRDARWLFADPAHDRFGEDVPEQILGDRAKLIVRDSVALVCYEEEWTFGEHVSAADMDDWLESKRTGPGRDPRLASTDGYKDDRVIVLRDQVRKYKKKDMPGWPFVGPRAVMELIPAVAKSGHELMVYPTHWIKSSGVSPTASVAIELTMIFVALHLLITFDGINPYNLAAAEHLSRRVLMIQRAVKRSARAPDFDGLDVFVANTFDATGGVITMEFDKWIATTQQSEAIIMKQHRLLREETHADTTHKKEKDKKGDGGGGGGGGGRGSGGGTGGGKGGGRGNGGAAGAQDS